MKKSLLLMLALLMSIYGCANQDKQKEESVSMGSGASPSQASAKPMSDEEITNAIMTVNTEEMSLTQVGRMKAQNPEVRQFAQKMYEEHAMSNDRLQKLADKHQLAPQVTKSADRMKMKTEKKTEKLKTMEGKQFDQAFMDSQIRMHEKTLERLDDQLIPNAKNQELKAMLQKTRGKVENHLQEARDLKQTI